MLSMSLVWFLLCLEPCLIHPSPVQEKDASESEAAGRSQKDAEERRPVPFLVTAPMVGRPTKTSACVNFVIGPRRASIEFSYGLGEERSAYDFGEEGLTLDPAAVHEIELEDLEPGQTYGFTLLAKEGDESETYEGRFVTQRPPGESFTVGIATDSHLPIPHPAWLRPQTAMERDTRQNWLRVLYRIGGELRAAMEGIQRQEVDFTVFLGDMLDLRAFGFNGGFPDDQIAELAYRMFRSYLQSAQAHGAFYAVIGNWEGENGDLPAEQIERARKARMKLMPNPEPSTYAPGGSEFEDYYAWSWGDADFIVLNVMGYTPTPHTLGHSLDKEGTATDWTLGEEQMAWFEETLENCQRKHRIVFIHHAVGGAAGDPVNSAYGRGGGQAARVGEQERVHELMLDHGVSLFFYGHDHVFTDMVVDGIHYTLTGACGAPWKFDTEETGYTDYDKRSGYTLLHVEPDACRVEFLGLDHKVFRSYEVKAR